MASRSHRNRSDFLINGERAGLISGDERVLCGLTEAVGRRGARFRQIYTIKINGL